MPVYSVKRCYILEDVELPVVCNKCGNHFVALVYSDARKLQCYCKRCGAITELSIVVCPECSSSANVDDSEHGPYCSSCDKLILDANI